MEKPKADLLEAAVSKCLRYFRCGQTVDEDGNPLALVDKLSAPDDGSIASGLREVEDMTCNIVHAVRPLISADN